MSDLVISAKPRSLGRSASRQLRREGLVPGIFYMNGKENVPVSVHPLALRPVVYTKDTHIVHLQVEGGFSHDCILKDVTFDPITDAIVHFDLQGIAAERKVTVEVPVVLVGQAVGVRDGGIIEHFLHKLTVECLPAHMPEHINVDITNLKIGESIHIGDLKVENVRFTGAVGTAIVAVTAPRVHKEDGAPAATEPEVVAAKGKKADA